MKCRDCLDVGLEVDKLLVALKLIADVTGVPLRCVGLNDAVTPGPLWRRSPIYSDRMNNK